MVYQQGQASNLKGKVSVDQEGVATGEFELKKEALPNILALVINPFYIGLEELPGYIFSIENGLNAIDKSSENIDENDPQLIWGAKVSKEFRVRVVQICKNIESQKGIAFSPNVLMNIMAFETASTFSSKAGTFKDKPNDIREAGYVGLIQFGKAAAEDLKVKRTELLNMTAEKQLDYVEKWFLLKTNDQLKSATDIYLSVNYPAASGKGHLDNEVVYGDPKAAYRANKPFLREADEKDKNGKAVGKEGGKTYVWEVREALEDTGKEGEYARNIWRNPLDKMELRGWYATWRPNDSNFGKVPSRDSGKHDGIDLYAPVGTPIFACVDGIRVKVGPNPSSTYGNTITIKGSYNGKEYHFFHAHLSEIYLKMGEKVKAGMKIGLTGKSGNAKNLLTKQEHLHFEVRKSNASQGAGIDPFEAISELKSTINVNPNKENQK
jgi:murein DD-endopeptidase MepM/ murein hydrolase activator NlpD